MNVRSVRDWRGIGSLNKLRRVDLSGSSFQDTADLGNLAALKTLTLDRCDALRDISSLGQLERLSHLSLRESLSNIPAWRVDEVIDESALLTPATVTFDASDSLVDFGVS
ncbi:hypothetical protein [Catellatospora sichuanensis]|uniref:hypothetical protein n=1 Tax=Catellatospora sichuanensis TaxID=1969805 RepID=UPI001182299B|nr:hypothetical protein [Catellatospora sichuanensis]